jgi:hypothetical protein
MLTIQFRDNLDPDSNLAEESDLHSQKYPTPKVSDDARSTISTKSVARNVPASIPENVEPDSNVTQESDLQSEKHSSPKTSINEGRMISTKPLPMNAHP